MVDFPQALTGLDYLKDIETRRRRESAAALGRLGIDKTALKKDSNELSKKPPGVAAWLKTTEASERKVDALYTQLYVALRRWVSPITALLFCPCFPRTYTHHLPDPHQRTLPLPL